MSALLLSLISIIYAIISNMNFSNQVGSLNDAAKIVSESSYKLKDVTHGLEAKVECLPSMIKDVSNLFEKGHNELKEVLETSVFNASTKVQINNNPVDQEAAHGVQGVHNFYFDDFLSQLSFSGMIILYALKLSHEKKVPFDSIKLWGQVKFIDDRYAYGFIIGISCCNLIEYTLKETIFNITEIHNDLKEINYTEHARLRITNIVPDNIDGTLNDTLGKIDEYFSSL